MSDDAQETFLRKHLDGLQVELDRLNAILQQIETGPVRHLDDGKFHRDVLSSVSAYQRSIDMWTKGLPQVRQPPA